MPAARLPTSAQLVAALALLIAPASEAGATERNVFSEAQLRQAILDLSADASGPHLINLLADITLNLGSLPQYTGTQNLSVAGNGHTIHGNSNSVFDTSVAPGVTLAVSGLRVEGASIAIVGGGDPISVADSTFFDMVIGASSNGAMTVTDSTFFDMAIGVSSNGAITVTDSAFFDMAFGTSSGGAMTITDSAFFDIAIAAPSGGTAACTNSTFSGNTIVFSTGAAVASTNCTFFGNTIAISGGTITLGNTIFDSNTIACSVGAVTLGGNVETGNDCGLNPGPDQVNIANAGLGPLQNNGGPTRTHALLPTSPARNFGMNCPPPGTDQRGVIRPQSGICDSGAFELLDANNDGVDDLDCDCFDAPLLAQPFTFGTCQDLGPAFGNYTQFLGWPFFTGESVTSYCRFHSPFGPNVTVLTTPSQAETCRNRLVDAATDAEVPCFSP